MDRPKRNARKKLDPNFIFCKEAGPQKSLEALHFGEDGQDFGKGMKSSVQGRLASSPSKGKESKATKKFKSCPRSKCPMSHPICFLGVTNSCARSGYTPRWYHMSGGEHYCNDCFEHFYRSAKAGAEEYFEWCHEWASKSQVEPNIKMFFADQYLPYWLQCNQPNCGKWKQVALKGAISQEFIATYQCGMKSDGTIRAGKFCTFIEDARVKDATTENWLPFLVVPPYLHYSPAEPFLVNYYPDGVGLSPYYTKKVLDNDSDSSLEEEYKPKRKRKKIKYKPLVNNIAHGATEYLQPFHQPYVPYKAGCIRPDVMEADELKQFPQYAGIPLMYLGVRNLIIALWNLNPKIWLTRSECLKNLRCRGLARIRCGSDMDSVLQYLTAKGFINAGCLLPPDEYLLKDCQDHIAVIGAGPSGLSTAFQLHKYGVKVTVIEARDRIGGRVCDTEDLGVCVGHGAQILIGSYNNPLSVLCHQLGISHREIYDHCELLNEKGDVTCSDMDKRIEHHFNALLDEIANWRKNRVISEDCNLLSKIDELHDGFLQDSNQTYSEEENRLLQFHLGNLEYACGCPLGGVSALMWDHNESLPQYGGCHLMLTDGYYKLFDKLSKNLNIKLNTPVTAIDYSGDEVKVTDNAGNTQSYSACVLTVPLTCLQKKSIKITPEMPQVKQKAIQQLGAGIIEKVGLKFPHRFWDNKIKHADVFGNVPKDVENRGLFNVFYDMSPKSDDAVLMTYASGEIVPLLVGRTKEEIVTVCVNVLKRIFPEESVPDPIASFVSSWQTDPYAGMSYTYMPVGCPPVVYEQISQTLDDKVYFAGEATNRQFPQTVTGAYLSGIREANRLLAKRGCMALKEGFSGATDFKTLADYRATVRNITRHLNIKRKIVENTTKPAKGKKQQKTQLKPVDNNVMNVCVEQNALGLNLSTMVSDGKNSTTKNQDDDIEQKQIKSESPIHDHNIEKPVVLNTKLDIDTFACTDTTSQNMTVRENLTSDQSIFDESTDENMTFEEQYGQRADIITKNNDQLESDNRTHENIKTEDNVIEGKAICESKTAENKEGSECPTNTNETSTDKDSEFLFTKPMPMIVENETNVGNINNTNDEDIKSQEICTNKTDSEQINDNCTISVRSNGDQSGTNCFDSNSCPKRQLSCSDLNSTKAAETNDLSQGCSSDGDLQNSNVSSKDHTIKCTGEDTEKESFS